MTVDEVVDWMRQFVIWSLRDKDTAKAGMQILKAHLDDDGKEFFREARRYRIGEINKDIAKLEQEKADLEAVG